jgi:quinol monooxygenase YgiN
MKVQAPRGVKVLSALLTPIPEKEHELLQTLDGLQKESRKEAGCLEFVVGQSVGAGTQILLFMVWKDLRSLNAYMATENFRVLLGATSILSAPADFRFIAANSTCAHLDSSAPPETPGAVSHRVPTAH